MTPTALAQFRGTAPPPIQLPVDAKSSAPIRSASRAGSRPASRAITRVGSSSAPQHASRPASRALSHVSRRVRAIETDMVSERERQVSVMRDIVALQTSVAEPTAE
jgi:hypothetical protein